MNMYQQAAPQGYYNPNFMAQGMVPNTQATMPKTGNWLPADKYALLQKGLSQFKLSVTEEDVAKGQCNHYYQGTGMSALIPDQDGSGGYTCAICGTHFTSLDWTAEDVQGATQTILDILNTIKVMNIEIDPNAALEYFQIIPFIEKIPQLYNITVNGFKKFENVDSFVPSSNQNPFNMFSMMTNPGFGMQQPMYGQQPMYQQPMYGQAPVNAGFAQQNPAFNPMYAQPMAAPAGYQPQPTGYAMNPMGAAAPGYVNSNMPMGNAPTAAAPETPKDVKVDTQFKK